MVPGSFLHRASRAEAVEKHSVYEGFEPERVPRGIHRRAARAGSEKAFLTRRESKELFCNQKSFFITKGFPY